MSRRRSSTTTGTLAVRGVLQNPKQVLLPGYFVRIRVPRPTEEVALLVPDVALGSDQGGRYVLVWATRTWSSSARSRSARWSATCG